MLKLIIEKEIRDNLLNVRFVVAGVLSMVLIISSIMVLTGIYQEERLDFNSRNLTQNDFVDKFGHSNRAIWMSMPLQEPCRYQPLVLGLDREARQENFISNPVPVLFSRLDFVTIVTIIMSLMAILFSYNAISGEREAGLLKQMLSNSVSRTTIVFGKFIGGNLSLLAPFTIGVLAGLLYLALSLSVQLQSMDFGIFLLLLLAAYFYIAAFYGLGLLFSARSHTSNQAVLKSLFAWVILVLIIPNVSPFLAAQIYRIPSWTKIQQEVFKITSEERDKIINQRGRELLQTQFSDITAITHMNRNEIDTKIQNDPAFKERYAQYAKTYDEMTTQVNKEQQAQAEKVLTNFGKQSEHQEKLATIFASISPVANFIFVATDVTETGITADNYWEQQYGRYLDNLSTYVKAKYQAEKQKNPAFESNDYLDMRDRPRFQYQPQPITERMARILPQFGLLAFFNLLFFAGAFVSFLRYDVR